MPRSRAPRLFRVLVPANDLRASRRFYETLLGVKGRSVGGGRIYFDCGSVIFGILDRSRTRPRARAPTEAVYFATNQLEQVHRRAQRLHCLSQELIHADPSGPAGQVLLRPWGERSFYATDPSGNPLCFVAARTVFTGTPAQVADAAQSGARRSKPRRAR